MTPILIRGAASIVLWAAAQSTTFTQVCPALDGPPAISRLCSKLYEENTALALWRALPPWWEFWRVRTRHRLLEEIRRLETEAAAE